jgi:hypothetical protein
MTAARWYDRFVLPVADIANSRLGQRARARATAARRTMRASLALSTVVIAIAVGAAQAASLFAVHAVLPAPALVVAVIVILAALACLWVGTFAFVRLATRRRGAIAAIATTVAFYGLALPLGTDHAALTVLGLVPAALIAAPFLVRLPWPPEPQRPMLRSD